MGDETEIASRVVASILMSRGGTDSVDDTAITVIASTLMS